MSNMDWTRTLVTFSFYDCRADSGSVVVVSGCCHSFCAQLAVDIKCAQIKSELINSKILEPFLICFVTSNQKKTNTKLVMHFQHCLECTLEFTSGI